MFANTPFQRGVGVKGTALISFASALALSFATPAAATKALHSAGKTRGEQTQTQRIHNENKR